MSKFEKILITFFSMCFFPLCFSFIFWWLSVAIIIYQVVLLPEKFIMIMTFVGLGIGILIAIIFSTYIIVLFYTIHFKYLVIIYLFLSAIAVAVFMGFPLGTIFLGVIAGIYLGRRHYHLKIPEFYFKKILKKASIFIGIITALEFFPFGIAGLKENYVFEIINKVTKIDEIITTGVPGIMAIVVLTILLAFFQFFCTTYIGTSSYRFTKKF